MPEDKKDEKKDGEKKEEGKIVLETAMKCENCRYEVYKAIVRYPGVEDVSIDFKNNKVTLKAPKVDAKKLFEFVKKKSHGKITKLLYPDPKEVKKEDPKKKPVEVTVTLKVGMDCSACTKKVEKAAWDIKDVQSIKVAGNILTIKGMDLDAKKVSEAITKKSGKRTEVVPPKKDGNKKDGDKKDGEKKDSNKKDGPKKDEKEPKLAIAYVLHPQYFSDENPNACTIM